MSRIFFLHRSIWQEEGLCDDLRSYPEKSQPKSRFVAAGFDGLLLRNCSHNLLCQYSFYILAFSAIFDYLSGIHVDWELLIMGVAPDLWFVKINVIVISCGTSDDIRVLFFLFSVCYMFGDSCTLTSVALSNVHLPSNYIKLHLPPSKLTVFQRGPYYSGIRPSITCPPMWRTFSRLRDNSNEPWKITYTPVPFIA